MTALETTIAGVREAVREARRGGATVGFVPTLGAFHAGHVSLVRAARAETGFVVVSIFVNPTQFGEGEDFRNYPRRLDADLERCRRESVDLVFAPAVEEMYPEGSATRIRVAGMSEKMCGTIRPGHFDGVCTVVAKLLNIVRPDVAYFGEKDAQQLAIVRRMAADLNMPVRIRPCPLMRDEDGLALSSRNRYLSDEQRQRALVLSRALCEGRDAIHKGERDATRLAEAVRTRIENAEGVDLEYVAVVDPDSLESLTQIRDKVLVAVAARVGPARLIDNVLLRGLGGAAVKDGRKHAD